MGKRQDGKSKIPVNNEDKDDADVVSLAPLALEDALAGLVRVRPTSPPKRAPSPPIAKAKKKPGSQK